MGDAWKKAIAPDRIKKHAMQARDVECGRSRSEKIACNAKHFGLVDELKGRCRPALQLAMQSIVAVLFLVLPAFPLGRPPWHAVVAGRVASTVHQNN